LTVAWLVCQFASLAAFVPVDCCEAHHPRSVEACHKAAVADECPMHATTGQACPMHSGASGTSDSRGSSDSSHDAAKTCAMRGMCHGPETSIAVLFSLPGILASETTVPVVNQSAPIAADALPSYLVARSFDTPPPRS